MNFTPLLIFLIIVIVMLVIILIVSRVKNEKKPDLNWATSVIYLAGFEYDKDQNIFVTRKDAMQRIGGYNDFYDRLSTLLYMVIDIEPIVYSVGTKKYMIELWKGQYYASTGCEFGLYHELEGKSGLWECAKDDELIHMEYELKNNLGKTIFKRSGKHWWLTGFKPGVFNNPSNLSMENIKLNFNTEAEAKAFYQSLSNLIKDKDPKKYNLSINGKTVSFRWGEPIKKQPNMDKRTEALKYDRMLSEYTGKLFKNDFSPTNINNEILNIKKFLEQDGTFYDFIDMMQNYSNNLLQKCQKWDKDNGTNMVTLFNLFAVMKDRKTLLMTMYKFLLKACDHSYILKFVLGDNVSSLCEILKQKK